MTAQKFTVETNGNVIEIDNKTIRLTLKAKLNGSEKLREYIFYELVDQVDRREARGVCTASVREESKESDTTFPSRMLARLPDFTGLESNRSKERYLKAFNREVVDEYVLLRSSEHCKVVCYQKCKCKVGDFELLLCEMPNEGDTLRRIIEAKAEGLTLDSWLAFSKRLITAVHQFHLEGIRHGYICPDNVIANSKLDNVHLINVEWNIPDPTLRIEGPSPSMVAYGWRRPYDSPDKICYPHDETGDGQAYDPFAPDDIFSLGLTLLYMVRRNLSFDRDHETLHPFNGESRWGKTPWNQITEPFLKSNETVKDEVYGDMVKAFVKEDKAKIIAATEIVFACLRTSEHRFYNMRGVLEVMERFDWTKPVAGAAGSRTAEPLDDVLDKQINTIASSLFESELLKFLYRDRLMQCVYPARQESGWPRFTVGRSRDEIVDALTALLLNAPNGSQCNALLTPVFWYEENCGPAGRVSSALRIAMARDCKVKLVMLMRDDRQNVPKVTHVMNHIRGWSETETNLQFRWVPLPRNKYKEILRKAESFLEVRADTDSVVAYPDYASENGPIIALRIVPGDRRDNKQSRFDDYFKAGLEISQYPHQWNRRNG